MYDVLLRGLLGATLALTLVRLVLVSDALWEAGGGQSIVVRLASKSPTPSRRSGMSPRVPRSTNVLRAGKTERDEKAKRLVAEKKPRGSRLPLD